MIDAALRASRRVNDYVTAVRIFEGVKEKVENESQYQAYLDELKPVRDEFGMFIKHIYHRLDHLISNRFEGDHWPPIIGSFSPNRSSLIMIICICLPRVLAYI